MMCKCNISTFLVDHLKTHGHIQFFPWLEFKTFDLIFRSGQHDETAQQLKKKKQHFMRCDQANQQTKSGLANIPGRLSKGSTWVKIDTRDSATRPFLSHEFSTRCLLSSDGHFHKIKFILRHATFWKRNKNDMRHFNINMIWHPKPQITYDATPDRAQFRGFLNASTMHFVLIPQCINSYQLN